MKNQLYYNGDIITMEKDTYVEAILVKNGIISKVGNYNDAIFN